MKTDRRWIHIMALYFTGVAVGFFLTYLAVNALAYALMRNHRWVTEPSPPVTYEGELPSVFAEHRRELECVEEYYHKVENWDFEQIYYWAEEDEPIYRCHVANGYNRGAYVMEEDFPFRELFESSLSRPESQGGYFCDITVKGNLSQGPEGLRSQRVIELEIQRNDEGRAAFLFQPEGVPQAVYGEDIRSLGNGWYSSVQEWATLY